MGRHTGLIALALLATSVPSHAATVSGTPRIIDGDTLEVNARRIRLFGIDAPEATQKCDKQGQQWACGQASAQQLQAMIGGSSVECRGNEVDQYGRLVAVCYVAGIDLNKTMVAQGWATAFRRYSNDYVADETRAKASKLGLWSSSFMAPEDYRHAQADAALPRVTRATVPQSLLSRPPASSASSGCVIKGNRGSNGWIYHVPGMPYYAQTRAEEMFCSEAQALAAGYRRAIVRP